MADRFFGNKNYVFRKKLLLKNLGQSIDEYANLWADRVDGEPVKVQNMRSGVCISKINNDYVSFLISPKWCEEVGDEWYVR